MTTIPNFVKKFENGVHTFGSVSEQDSDVRPGDKAEVDCGGNGAVTGVVKSVIITDDHGTFYRILVDPEEKLHRIGIFAPENWVEKL